MYDPSSYWDEIDIRDMIRSALREERKRLAKIIKELIGHDISFEDLAYAIEQDD